MTNTKLDIHKSCNRFPPSLSYFVFFQNHNVVVLVFFLFWYVHGRSKIPAIGNLAGRLNLILALEESRSYLQKSV